MRKILILVVALLIPQLLVAADNYFYCTPNNQPGGYIYPADTMDRVMQVCGKPDETTEEKTTAKKTEKVTRCIYNYVPYTADKVNSISKINVQGLVVDFVNRKVSQILVEGTSVDSSDYCRMGKKQPIKIGDTAPKVLAACGSSMRCKKFDRVIPDANAKQIIWTYQQIGTPIKLYFKDGKVEKID
jgi:hypothetical protein